ncbi:MAG: leucyl/phenylalanyl-tRNA--protein transferase [Pseudomonadota bacterium]|nr:leucyl/phenylalanyl-tRNA--protein transferase [Pseudomonadota bacterium]
MIKIPVLGFHTQDFPPIEHALDDPNGLLAAGGDLSPERLIDAYSKGIFPWFDKDQPILWWSPSPRAVLFPDQLHVSRSLRKTLRKGTYQVTMDTAFTRVIRACSEPRQYSDGTWITEDMMAAYTRLHELGFAHSVEAWRGNDLVGGLYGIALGRMYFGESMFSRATDASKVAFVHLVGQLKAWGFELIDCQVENPHLVSLGSTNVDRATFKELLHNHVPAVAELARMEPRPWSLDWKYCET